MDLSYYRCNGRVYMKYLQQCVERMISCTCRIVAPNSNPNDLCYLPSPFQQPQLICLHSINTLCPLNNGIPNKSIREWFLICHQNPITNGGDTPSAGWVTTLRRLPGRVGLHSLYIQAQSQSRSSQSHEKWAHAQVAVSRADSLTFPCVCVCACVCVWMCVYCKAIG